MLAALLALVLVGGPAAPAALAAPTATRTSLALSHEAIRKGEMVWLGGTVRSSSGKALKGVKVKLQRKVAGGSWKTFATLTTRSDGSFSQRQRPTKEYTYRAVVVGGSKVRSSTSPKRSVDLTVGPRSLGDRAEQLASVLGKSKGAARTVTVKGLDRVRYKDFAKGMLVEVVKNGTRRTWLVYGDILRAYRKAGGPTGSLGVPSSDPRCGLLEAGCVQRFTKGAIYDNKEIRGIAVKGDPKAAEVLAAARSQVGYVQRRTNDTKYNRWVGSVGYAWCSIFTSWASRAAGRGDVIPKHGRFKDFLADVRKNLPTGSTPKVGALVFFDTIDDGVVEATHVGLVLEVKGSTIRTVEGNTSNPKNVNQRGVWLKERELSRPLFYAYPRY